MAEQVKGIQRYDVVFRVDDEGRGFEGYRKVEDANGAYVLFKDHEQALAALEAGNKKLEAALLKALVAFDAFWPSDPPENETQIDEDRAVAEVRKLARAALKGAS